MENVLDHSFYYWNPGRGTDREGDRISGPRWLGIGYLIAEPEGPTFISYKVARSRLDRLRFVTQDPERTLGLNGIVAIWSRPAGYLVGLLLWRSSSPCG
jgi:hypothetical protein